jgi:hypothetical protein
MGEPQGTSTPIHKTFEVEDLYVQTNATISFVHRPHDMSINEWLTNLKQKFKEEEEEQANSPAPMQ